MSRRTVPLGDVCSPSLAEVSDSSITGGEMHRRKTAPDLLERFCGIAEAPDTAAAVVAFAKRWGVLGLCEHGLPYGHVRFYEPMFGLGGRRLTSLDQYQGTDRRSCLPGAESFQHWKELAVRFDSMLRVGLDLNRGKIGSDLDWELVSIDPDFSGWKEQVGFLLSIDEARLQYAALVRRLIQMAQLEPRFYWSNGVWNIDLDSYFMAYSNLPAILTAQLMLRVSSAKTQIKCSECPRWFIPRRNQRKYCNHCGKRAMWRVAQRKRKGQIDEKKKTRKR
jgi:hypothetical protein